MARLRSSVQDFRSSRDADRSFSLSLMVRLSASCRTYRKSPLNCATRTRTCSISAGLWRGPTSDPADGIRRAVGTLRRFHTPKTLSGSNALAKNMANELVEIGLFDPKEAEE